MKRILLGTSALCAVAVAGPAFAQTANEPVKLGIGGFWNSAYGYLFSQSGGQKGIRRADDIDTDAIINFKGNTKLDNGLVVGASVQIRATNQIPGAGNSADLTTPVGDTVKRSYAYIRSDFGEVRIGDDDDARRQKAIAAPVAGPLFGANTPDMIFANGSPGLTNTTMKTISTTKRVSRLAYFSPTIAGFSFAASYAPGGEKGGTGNNLAPSETVTNGVNAINNEVSAAGAYNGKFGDFSLDSYVGLSSGHRVRAVPVGTLITGRNNPFAIGGGAVVGFGPFSFGGAYEHLYDRDEPTASLSGHQKRDTWDIGPRYTIGPFSVSVDWTRAILQNFNGNSSAQNDVVSLATDYVLGPGIDVGVGLDWTHFKPTAPTTAAAGNVPYTGFALMAGVGLGF